MTEGKSYTPTSSSVEYMPTTSTAVRHMLALRQPVRLPCVFLIAFVACDSRKRVRESPLHAMLAINEGKFFYNFLH